MTVKEPTKPPKTKKGKKNQKSKSNKKPNKTQSNKTKVHLSENDLKLIVQYLETNRTEAITTNRIIEEALGKKPERALQMEVSDILKDLGWENTRTRINGKQVRVWINPSMVSSKKVVTKNEQPQNPDKKGLINCVTTSDLETSNNKSDTISSPELDYPSIANKTPASAIKAPGKDEIANSVPQESIDTEKEIKEIAEILLLCPETFLELQDLYGSAVAKAACRLLPMATIDFIRESIEQRHKSIPRMKPIKNIDDRTALTCDVAGIPLEVGDIVKLYSESLIAPKSIGKIIEIKQQYQRIKVLVQWKNGEQSEYFGEDRVKTTGSYFIEIKKIRKFICEEGIYYAATL